MKLLTRIVALLLIPCFVADPTFAAALFQSQASSSPCIFRPASQVLFREEALAAAIELSHTLIWRSKEAFRYLSQLGRMVEETGAWELTRTNAPSGANVVMPEQPNRSLFFSQAIGGS